MSGFYAAIGSLGSLPGRDRVLGVGRSEAIALEDARQGGLADPAVPRHVYALVELTPAQHSRVLCGEHDAIVLGLAPASTALGAADELSREQRREALAAECLAHDIAALHESIDVITQLFGGARAVELAKLGQLPGWEVDRRQRGLMSAITLLESTLAETMAAARQS